MLNQDQMLYYKKVIHVHFFEKFYINSQMTKWVFDSDPCLKKQEIIGEQSYYKTYMKIVVLQVLYLANDELLCELVDKKDF